MTTYDINDMEIWAKVYRKRDGSIMLYINNDRGVSLGISERVFTSKLSNGQEKLLYSWLEAIDNDENARDFNGNFDAHTEDKAHLDFDINLYITDVATVCGQSVGSDGAYITRKGKIITL